MRKRIFLALAAVLFLFFLAIFAGKGQDTEQSKAERYIKEGEAAWAEAASKGDTDTIERVVADDYIGVDPDGNFYNKATELSNTRNDHGAITVSNHVNDINVRFYGDTAVAQGTETWEVRRPAPKRGSYVWTDTWIKRNGKWQIVAAEDLTVAPIEKK
jgi:ketosteroid isomerase-like protein